MRKRRFAIATGLLVFGLLALLALLGLIGPAHAAVPRETDAPVADSDLDSTFGNAGVVTMNVPGTFVRAIALFDGKVLALLSQPDDPDSEYSKTTGKLLRFNEDGSLDTSFGINGIVEPRSIDPAICLQNNAGFTDFDAQTDGKILAWYECGFFMRLMPNGTTDNGFGQQGMIKAEGGSRWLATAPDGKLYLGWPGSPLGGWSIAHYFVNGVLDADFGISGTIKSCIFCDTISAQATSFSASLLGIVPLQDGSVVLGHDMRQISQGGGNIYQCIIDVYPAHGQNRNRLPNPLNLCFYGIRDGYGRMMTYGPCMTCTTRLNADGSVDTSFGFSGTISSTLGLNRQPRQHDGKVVCLPTYWTIYKVCPGNWPESNQPDIMLARIDTLGQRDNSFGNNGIMSFVFTYTIKSTIPPTIIRSSRANDVSLEFNGRILIAGSYQNNVAQCNMPPFCTETIRRFPVLSRLIGARFPIEKRYLPVIQH